jgi:RimJ/RimL family protein N-acetyltransferase
MIREMTIEDVPRIAEMAKSFHEYAIADKGLGFSPSDFTRYSVFLMKSPAANILIADVDGVAVGTIAGIITPWFMNFSQLILTELWWWVDPEHRKGKIAFELLDALTEWGKYCGVSKLIMVSIGSDREEIVKRYYKRKGFIYMETQFVKEI